MNSFSLYKLDIKKIIISRYNHENTNFDEVNNNVV